MTARALFAEKTDCSVPSIVILRLKYSAKYAIRNSVEGDPLLLFLLTPPEKTMSCPNDFLIRPLRFFQPARLLPAIFLLLAPLFFSLTGNARAADAPLPVIVSIAPQKYMLERIAGNRVAVSTLVKPGADPHSYEPSPSQMRACASARVWFTIGVPFEDVWLPRIRGAAPDLAVVSLIARIKRLSFADDAPLPAHDNGNKKSSDSRPASAVPPGSLHPSGTDAAPRTDEVEREDHHEHHQHKEHLGNHQHEEHHGHHQHDEDGDDPHVWLSPMLVRAMLSVITRELGRLLPEHAAEFRSNAAAFAEELEKLDKELAERFSAFPREKRVFLTFHPSWRYFAHNYELTELAIEVNGKEPGPQGMEAVIRAAETYGIHTIFVEPQFPEAAARAVAANIGAKVVKVDPLAENLPALYRDLADKLMESFAR